jgi:hypothetical protein
MTARLLTPVRKPVRPFDIDTLARSLYLVTGDGEIDYRRMEEALGVTHGAIRRRGHQSLTLDQACDWAERLETHPALVWSHYIDVVLDEAWEGQPL